MKLLKCVKWSGTILILATFIYCASAESQTRVDIDSNHVLSGQKTRKVPKDLNILVPIGKILGALTGLASVNLELLLQALVKLLPCIPAGSSQSLPLPFTLPTKWNSTIDVRSNNLEINLDLIRSSIEALALTPIPGNYCSTPEFKTVHDFLWKDDTQFRDILGFLYRFGVKPVYLVIVVFYQECPAELIRDLPTGPLIRNMAVRSNAPLPDIRNQVLKSTSLRTTKSTLIPFQNECNLWDIAISFLQSGAINLLEFIETLLLQINTDPSLHFLLGKIQEPAKGVSFREFRQLEEMRRLFQLLNTALMENETIDAIFELVFGILGLDLRQINLVELVLSILEMFLWQNFEPIEVSNV